MIGIKMPPPWRLHGAGAGTRVYHHPDGRFAVGIEKEVTHALRNHGARGHIIIGTVCHYIEGTSVQSALDRTQLVRKAFAEINSAARCAEVIDEMTQRSEWIDNNVEGNPVLKQAMKIIAEVPPATKRITRTRRA